MVCSTPECGRPATSSVKMSWKQETRAFCKPCLYAYKMGERDILEVDSKYLDSVLENFRAGIS